MEYISTRGKTCPVTASKAILTGIAPDGGLYTPVEIPFIGKERLASLKELDYAERAAKILSIYLGDYTPDELRRYAQTAYKSFDTPAVAPVVKQNDDTFILELFHGPTYAFKDLALQILPHLLTGAMRKNGEKNKICILVATSGDTGKAALEGFKDVPGTGIVVFYPKDGVSEIQRRQMITQAGNNVGVCAVEGNFDDAQTGVKGIFADKAFAEQLGARGIMLSSANSINWGRLVPQIVYYISAWCELLVSGEIGLEDEINFCVPTGNFGNILAAYFAKRMGLPIGKLICASNANNVLTDFISTGVYDRNRRFYATNSPSMDILVSSNVERLVFELGGRDGERTAEYMRELASKGRYELSDEEAKELSELFASGWCDDSETLAEIRNSYKKYGYLPDTHTAVALKVLADYRARTGDGKKTVVVSTASPFKFGDSVLLALTGKVYQASPRLVFRLSEAAGLPVPPLLADLENIPPRFTGSVPKEDMHKAVERMIDGFKE